MSDKWPEAKPPGTKPLINSIFDFTAESLGQLKLWFEQNPPTISLSQITGYQSQVQKTVDVNVFMTPVSNVVWNGRFGGGSDLVYGSNVSSGAQDAEIVFNVLLSAGTWTFEMMHYQFTNRGIYTITLTASNGTDVTTIGTVDGYAAVATFNKLDSVTGIPVRATDSYALKLKMASKNGAASAYYGAVQHIQFRKTA